MWARSCQILAASCPAAGAPAQAEAEFKAVLGVTYVSAVQLAIDTGQDSRHGDAHERHVKCQKRETKRQHPKSWHRQDEADAAAYLSAGRRAARATRLLPAPTLPRELHSPLRQMPFQAVDLADEWSLRLVRPTMGLAHGCSEEVDAGLARKSRNAQSDRKWSAASLARDAAWSAKIKLDGGPGSRPTLST